MSSFDDFVDICTIVLLLAPPIIVLLAISIFLVRLNLNFARNTLICWTLCACFIALIFLISYKTPFGIHCDFGRFWYRNNLADGSLRIAFYYDNWKPNDAFGFHSIGAYPSEHDTMHIGSASTQVRRTRHYRLDYLAIPLWLFANLAAGCSTLIAMWLTYHSPKRHPGRCRMCKYDISACTSNKCPECGCQIAPTRPE